MQIWEIIKWKIEFEVYSSFTADIYILFKETDNMNKPLKHKSSNRNIKTNKSIKLKDSSTFTSRTPL